MNEKPTSDDGMEADRIDFGLVLLDANVYPSGQTSASMCSAEILSYDPNPTRLRGEAIQWDNKLRFDLCPTFQCGILMM